MRSSLGLLVLAVLAAGCPHKGAEPPIWEQVKITDLAPKDPNRAGRILDTTDLDIYVFHIPAAKIKSMRGLWDGLNPRPIRYANYNAFRSNAFRVAQGTLRQLDWVIGSIAEASGRLAGSVSVWLQGQQEHDVKICTLPIAQAITHSSKDYDSQKVMVGPGIIALRLRADPMATGVPIRRLVAYPVFSLGHGGPIDQLARIAKEREVVFMGAGFAVPIREGDIVVLGPEEYCGDQSTLSGVFFRHQEPVIDIDPSVPASVQRVQVYRVYAIVCKRIGSSGR